jgi:hypothetical protein
VSPYYKFGFQPAHYAVNWSGGAGGIPGGTRSAVRRGMGILPLEESGGPPGHHFPALAQYHPGPVTHSEAGDWPALRPAGPEPLSFWGGLSDNEKSLALLGGAVAAWYFFLRKRI